MPHSWVHSIYNRTGYKIRAGTTSRPPVPYGLFAESRYSFLSSIAETIEKLNIPPELVFNRGGYRKKFDRLTKRIEEGVQGAEPHIYKWKEV